MIESQKSFLENVFECQCLSLAKQMQTIYRSVIQMSDARVVVFRLADGDNG